MNRVDYVVPNVADSLGTFLVNEASNDVGVRPRGVACGAYGCNGVAGHDFLTIKIQELVAVHEQDNVLFADEADDHATAFVSAGPGLCCVGRQNARALAASQIDTVMLSLICSCCGVVELCNIADAVRDD